MATVECTLCIYHLLLTIYTTAGKTLKKAEQGGRKKIKTTKRERESIFFITFSHLLQHATVEAEILASSWPLPSIQNKTDVSATFYNRREEVQGKKRKRRKGTVGGAACVDGCASEEEQKEKEEEGVQAGGGAGEEVEEEERNALGGCLMEIRGAAAER